MESDDLSEASSDVFERTAEISLLLSRTSRLKIMSSLCAKEMNVSELMNRLAMPQPTLSQQLGLLYRAGLLSGQRDGAQVFYRAHEESSAFLCSAVKCLLR